MDVLTVLTVFSALRQLRQREHWTPPQLMAYQADALRWLREYTYEHSPFYQQFHRGMVNRPFEELPVLTKSMLMEHFDDLVTDHAIHLEDIRAHMNAEHDDEHYLDRYRDSGNPYVLLISRPKSRVTLTVNPLDQSGNQSS